MNQGRHIAEDDLALYAMGALSADEMSAARAHVANCARCSEELRQIDRTLAAYAQTTPEIEVPAGAKQRFMARVAQNETPALSPKPVQPETQKPRERKPSLLAQWFGSPRFSLTLAGAMALLLIAVAYDDYRKSTLIGPLVAAARQGRIDSAQMNQLMELLTSAQVQRVALHEKPAPVPPPEARVLYSAHNGKLLLTAQNLHPLPAGKTYELWILQAGGKAPMPAGTFAPDSRGNAAMILADEPANVAATGFAVTVEKEGGSQTPTMPIILSGQ